MLPDKLLMRHNHKKKQRWLPMRGNLVSNELLPMLLAAGARKRFPIYWRYCQILMIF
jgi:hypothetical protein